VAGSQLSTIRLLRVTAHVGGHPAVKAAVHGGHAATATAPAVSAGHLLLQLLLGLGVVVALVVGCSRLLRGRSGASRLAGRRSPLRVVARHSLGKGVSVAVVELGDRAFLVGVTPSSVRRLAETDAAALEAATARGVRDGAGSAVPVAPLDQVGRTVVRAGRRALGLADPELGAGAGGQRTPGRTAPGDRRSARVVEILPVPGAVGEVDANIRRRRPAAAPVRRHDHGPVDARRDRSRWTPVATGSSGQPSAPTWMSAIEHLRERTVRRA
jgi:flagellar protein FliO/FliZ